MIGESYTLLSNSAAATSSTFRLNGGRYALTAEATFGSLQLQLQLPNGTWVSAGSAMTANGFQIITIPAGSVRAVATGGSGYYSSLVKVPD